jgi:hypothetical protein
VLLIARPRRPFQIPVDLPRQTNPQRRNAEAAATAALERTKHPLNGEHTC